MKSIMTYGERPGRLVLFSLVFLLITLLTPMAVTAEQGAVFHSTDGGNRTSLTSAGLLKTPEIKELLSRIDDPQLRLECERNILLGNIDSLSKLKASLSDRETGNHECHLDARFAPGVRELEPSSIISISSEGTSMVIRRDSNSDVAVGDILVGTEGEGFLLKVIAVIDHGDKFELITEQATLEEAIEECDISFGGELGAGGVRDTRLADGVSFEGFKSGQGYRLSLNDVVVYDHDGNPATTYDQITISGTINVKPEFDFDMEIEHSSLQKLQVQVDVQEDLALTANYRVSATFEPRKEICQFYLNPIIIPTAVPIIITPDITIIAGARAETRASISTGITQTADVTAIVLYDHGDWSSSVEDFSNQFGFLAPYITANGKGKAYIGPRVNFKLYGVLGPHIEVHGYSRIIADLFQKPWWILYGGVEAGLGIKMTIFSSDIINWEKPNLLVYEKLLAQAAQQTPAN